MCPKYRCRIVQLCCGRNAISQSARRVCVSCSDAQGMIIAATFAPKAQTEPPSTRIWMQAKIGMFGGRLVGYHFAKDVRSSSRIQPR